VSTERYVVVWDLDRTLGLFDPLASAPPNEAVTVYLREGIAQALEQLSAMGFTHTVLTLASPRYADIALRGTGLRDHFVEVSGVGERAKGDAEGIGDKLGIAGDERGDRMFFVGDHPIFDAPQDARVVFHLEPNALHRRAQSVVSLVGTLRELGSGSLRAGFDAMLGDRTGVKAHHIAHDGVGDLLLIPRTQQCPVICFDGDGDVSGGTPVTIGQRSTFRRRSPLSKELTP